ncbi:MAG: hypothetical protein MK447_03435 [SAR324 cluster bacterium]|nr:hypothetical protein [SAR324 cluster bacterium]
MKVSDKSKISRFDFKNKFEGREMDVGGIQWGWRFSLILDGPLVLMSEL